MKIVIDANILMAGLIRESIVREILISKKIDFFIPYYAIQEIRNYQRYLCRKSGYSKEDFEFIFNSLLENIKIVPADLIKPYMKKADLIMKEIDLKDSSFIATCFAINVDGIWSFDKHFKKQSEVRVFSIKEMIENA